MQFETCTHGNIAMTCPQCRGRAPVASSPAVSGFGLPARGPAPVARPGVRVPEDDSLEGLYDQLKSSDSRFNVVLGGMLDELVTGAEKKVIASSDREARQVKGFWQQINAPTTVEEHDKLRES